MALVWGGRMDQLMVQVERWGFRPVGWKGKVQLKCGGGRKVLVAVGPLSRRARPFQEGRAPFREGAPLLLIWLAGGSSPFRRFGDFLLFFHAAKSWWKLDPLAVIQAQFNPPPPTETHTVCINCTGKKIPIMSECTYLQSLKSVKHNAAKSVNRSTLKKSRHIGFGVFIVHSLHGTCALRPVACGTGTVGLSASKQYIVHIYITFYLSRA